MTDHIFRYDEKELYRCAKSPLASSVMRKNQNPLLVVVDSPVSSARLEEVLRDDQSCLHLFDQHAQHYSRQHERQDRIYEKSVVASRSNNRNKQKQEPNESYYTNDDQVEVLYHLGPKLQNFVRNSCFVVEHNQNQQHTHQVTLNRFSDLPLDHMNLHQEGANRRRTTTATYQTTGSDPEIGFGWDDQHDSWGMPGSDHAFLTYITSSKQIFNISANLAIGKGSMHALDPKNPNIKKPDDADYPTSVIEVPLTDGENFQTPDPDPQLEGSLLSVKKNHDYDRHKKKQRRSGGSGDSDDDSASYEDIFDIHLNWATANNPDGVPLVNEPFDQGSCGSCWAFSAAGSLEANAARREAYQTYSNFLSDHVGQFRDNATGLHEAAILAAQASEASAFRSLNLSIQELLDCDRLADQGCTGGNPLLAFYFIRRYGLTSWNNYPYVGYQDECRKNLIEQPVATVKSWGLISPNHEKHMELVLRYIGPIAVGINGADPSFLAYRGGIFDRPHCKQGANHALLIVGYGQVDDGNGSRIKYWVARNSWGRGWGEKGYVRVKRTGGGKGKPGVCGIARGPSVALGGIQIVGNSGVSVLPGKQPFEKLAYSPLEQACLRLGWTAEGYCGRTAHWIESHKASALGVVGILLAMLAVWPLTIDVRRRSRLRKLRQEKRQKELARLQKTQGESLPLLPDIEPCAESEGKEDNGGKPTDLGSSAHLHTSRDCSM